MKNKIAYISALRVFSMLSVVMIHVCIMGAAAFGNTASLNQAACLYAIRNLLHYAVPIFMMITGALQLNPDKNLSSSKFRGYIVKYSLDIVVFGWVFALMEVFFQTHAIGLREILGSFWNMISGDTWNHMWYLYTLIGITLILPMMRTVIAECEKTNGGGQVSAVNWVSIFNVYSDD